MKNKTRIAFAAVAAVLALAFIGAKENSPRPALDVGSSYLISNGAAAVRGKVVSDNGNGWYSVDRGDGRPQVLVNVANAFFIEPTR